MAPVRRYMRLTKNWVIEVRIYSEPPSITDSWLLKRSDPAIVRIMRAVRPNVMPKLREQREQASKKGKAAKRVGKDTITGDDFEVSMFLTENSSRHTLVTKVKTFQDEDNPHPKAKQTRQKILTADGGTDVANDVDDEAVGTSVQEEDTEHPIDLEAIPEVGVGEDARHGYSDAESAQSQSLFVGDGDADTRPPTRRRRGVPTHGQADEDDDGEDRKKFAINTTYNGFAIYGHTLCLVVKRRGSATKSDGSQKMLENWVSTQAGQDAGVGIEAEDG